MNTQDDDTKPSGLLIIYTGNGKGKTTASLGAAWRAMGRGWKVGMVQFIKGKWMTGERLLADQLPLLDLYVMGKGFTWESDDIGRDRSAAQNAWEHSKKLINSSEYPLVILDEITYALHYGFLELADVIAELQRRPKDVHVILTGRNAPEELVEIADLVSEMNSVKHPFEKGQKARLAIDY